MAKRRRHKKKRRQYNRFLDILDYFWDPAHMLFLVIFIAIIVFAIFGIRFGIHKKYYKNHFLPNTTINGKIDAGKMTLDKVESELTTMQENYTLTVEPVDVYMTADQIDYQLMTDENTTTLTDALAAQKVGFFSVKNQKGNDITITPTWDADQVTIALSGTAALDADVEAQDSSDESDASTESDAAVEEDAGDTASDEETTDASESEESGEGSEDELGTSEEDAEKLREAVDRALLNGNDTVTLLDVYSYDGEQISPDAEASYDTWMNADITVEDEDGHSLEINNEVVSGFIEWDDDGKPVLNTELITDYVHDNYPELFNTVGETREINSPATGDFTITGGTYGRKVDQTAEVAAIVEDIQNGSVTTREPNYSQTETGNGAENDYIGTTYAEVDINSQKVYYIEDNEVVFTADCVTGNVANGTDTPKGNYYIVYKTTDYDMVEYESHVDYWMPFYDFEGIGFHDASWRTQFGGTIYQTDGSHGCVNLSTDDAAALYDLVEQNLPVVVH